VIDLDTAGSPTEADGSKPASAEKSDEAKKTEPVEPR
jgi:hypothetical protein